MLEPEPVKVDPSCSAESFFCHLGGTEAGGWRGAEEVRAEEVAEDKIPEKDSWRVTDVKDGGGGWEGGGGARTLIHG